MPTGALTSPPSGVAYYVRDLLAHCPQADCTVIAQRDCRPSHFVRPTWRPGVTAPFAIVRYLAHKPAAIIHFQHEFKILGGVGPTALFVALLPILHHRHRVVVTIHGIPTAAALAEISPAIRRHPLLRLAAVTFFWLNFHLLSLMDATIVPADALKDSLATYGVDVSHVCVMPLGTNDGDPTTGKSTVRDQDSIRHVLVFGFLTDYKAPELVVDLADSAPSALRFSFAVGRNPRSTSRQYQRRYRALEGRVRGLGSDRAQWLGYVPDDVLPTLLSSTDVIVLPYTACIAASGVAALAVQYGIPLCYSRPLVPLYGDGLGVFDLTSTSLLRALEQVLRTTPAPPAGVRPWRSVAEEHRALWARLLVPAAQAGRV